MRMVRRSITEALLSREIEVVDFITDNETAIENSIKANPSGAAIIGSVRTDAPLRIGSSAMHSFPVSIKIRAINAGNQKVIASSSKSARKIHISKETGTNGAIKVALEAGLEDIADAILENRGKFSILQVRNDCHKSNKNLFLQVTPIIVEQGETIELVSCYHQLATTDVTVTEATSIHGFGVDQGLIAEEIERTQGYWESRYEINFPESFSKGSYTIIQKVSYPGTSMKKNQTITVR